MNNQSDNHVQLDSLIKQIAQDHQPQLPNPQLIWWRAQILKRQADKERIERPMVMMKLIAVTIGAVAVFALIIANAMQTQTPATETHIPFLTLLLVLGALGCALLLALLVWTPATKSKT